MEKYTTLERAAELLELDLSMSDREAAEWLREQYGRAHVGKMGPGYDIQCSLDGVTLDGRTKYRWSEFARDCRAVLREREIVRKNGDGAPAALARIEARIYEHMQGAYRNILEVGRCLTEAKESGLVPHGQWEKWVEANTGMDARRAQRLMQAARNAPEGSQMARLPVSHITALLALPEGEREAAAERAAEEKQSLKQLKEEIARLQKRGDQALEKYEQARQRAQRLEGEKAGMERAMREAEAMDEERIATRLDAERERYERKMELLEASRDEAYHRGETTAAAEVAQLKRELAEAEAYAEKQAELRQEAQQALLNAQAGRGGGAECPPFDAAALRAAVRAFLGEAGVMTQMGAELARMPAGAREDMRRQLDMVDSWLQGARRALGTYLIEAAQ